MMYKIHKYIQLCARPRSVQSSGFEVYTMNLPISISFNKSIVFARFFFLLNAENGIFVCLFYETRLKRTKFSHIQYADFSIALTRLIGNHFLSLRGPNVVTFRTINQKLLSFWNNEQMRTKKSRTFFWFQNS